MAGYIGSTAVSLSTTAANVDGNITVTGNVDGRDVSVDGTKLDTIPIISTSSVASFTAKGDGSSQDGYIQLNCYQNTHGIKLKSPPHSAGASYTLVFPVNDGDSGQFLRTDGSGVLSWGTDATLDNTKLPLAGGAMTGAITTNSTFDGVDVGARDAVLTDTTTKATVALPKTGGAMTGAITTNSTFDGVDIATRNAVLTTTTNTANAALPKAGGAMTGAITTNSTFDGRDVAADGVLATNALPKAGGAMTGAITTNSTFDGVDIATRDAVLTSTTTTAGAALPKAGGNITGQVNSVFAGGGDFIHKFQNTTAGTPYGVMIKDASSGATGYPLLNITNNGGSATHFRVDSGLGRVGMGVTPHASAKLTLGGTDSEGYTAALRLDNNNTNGAEFFIVATDNNWSAGANKLLMGHGAPSSGNVDITITSGGTVGFGTTSPSSDSIVTISNGGAQGIEFRADSSRIEYMHYNRSANAYMSVRNNGLNFEWYLQNGPKMVLDGSGNLLVGKTSNDFALSGSIIRSGGEALFTRAGDLLTLNRLTSDGTAISFRKNGTTVGSIGSVVGQPYFISGNRGIRIAGNNIRPTSTGGANLDNVISLGDVTQRFKDLYLSGGVLLGGIGSANKLDDVETGNWNPTFNGYSTGFKGTYVRVGMANGGTVTCRITRWASIPSGSFSGNLTITGLPFTAGANGTNSSGSGQNTHQMHIRAAATGQANAPWGMINGTSMMMHLPSVFGSTNVYPGQAATYDSAKFTQNGNTSVILDFTFTYLTT